jgi:hypothetical protein
MSALPPKADIGRRLGTSAKCQKQTCRHSFAAVEARECGYISWKKDHSVLITLAIVVWEERVTIAVSRRTE